MFTKAVVSMTVKETFVCCCCFFVFVFIASPYPAGGHIICILKLLSRIEQQLHCLAYESMQTITILFIFLVIKKFQFTVLRF